MGQQWGDVGQEKEEGVRPGWAVWAKEKEERARALVGLTSGWAERGEGERSRPGVKFFVFLFSEKAK
jgi:hypothetical protein